MGKPGVSALLVHGDNAPLAGLGLMLEGQGIRVTRVRTCNEALEALARANRPSLAFTATDLPDGSWYDVQRIAEETGSAVQVIVVARFVDVQLYLRVIESHAFDLIVPPFHAPDVAHLVRSAVLHSEPRATSTPVRTLPEIARSRRLPVTHLPTSAES